MVPEEPITSARKGCETNGMDEINKWGLSQFIE